MNVIENINKSRPITIEEVYEELCKISKIYKPHLCIKECNDCPVNYSIRVEGYKCDLCSAIDDVLKNIKRIEENK